MMGGQHRAEGIDTSFEAYRHLVRTSMGTQLADREIAEAWMRGEALKLRGPTPPAELPPGWLRLRLTYSGLSFSHDCDLDEMRTLYGHWDTLRAQVAASFLAEGQVFTDHELAHTYLLHALLMFSIETKRQMMAGALLWLIVSSVDETQNTIISWFQEGFRELSFQVVCEASGQRRWDLSPQKL